MTASGRRLRALGTLAPKSGEDAWSAASLDRSRTLPERLRGQVVDYLEGCPIFLAWMGQTRDEIGGRFEVPGGSAIASDGTYYWRVDGVQYIRVYGIPVPDDAIAHFESRRWIPPSIDQDQYVRIYGGLVDLLGGGELVG